MATTPGDLSQLDLNLLYTFQVVVETGSVGAAAKRLFRTQPAISTRLKQLESHLGVTLFERAGRGLALSPTGRSIERDVESLLQGVRQVLDRARASEASPAGTLRVGTLPTVATYLLAPYLSAFLDAHPAVELDLRVGLTAGYTDELLAGKLDLVLSIGEPPRHRRITTRVLTHVSPVLVLTRRGARDFPSVPSPRDLQRVALLGFGRVGDAFFDAVWAFLLRHGLDRAVRLTIPHIQAHKALILHGAGASILPDYTIVEPGLVARRVRGLDFREPVWVASRASSRAIPAVARFVEGLPAALRRR